MKIADLLSRIIMELPPHWQSRHERTERLLREQQEDVAASEKDVRLILEKWAGHVECGPKDSPDQRLASPRLKTTPRGERRQALTRRALGYADSVGEHLGPAIEAMIKLALCEYELEQEDRRDRFSANAKDIKVQLKLYAEVAKVAETLFHDHKVTYRHWACLNQQEIAKIARILLRSDPAT